MRLPSLVDSNLNGIHSSFLSAIFMSRHADTSAAETICYDSSSGKSIWFLCRASRCIIVSSLLSASSWLPVKQGVFILYRGWCGATAVLVPRVSVRAFILLVISVSSTLLFVCFFCICVSDLTVLNTAWWSTTPGFFLKPLASSLKLMRGIFGARLVFCFGFFLLPSNSLHALLKGLPPPPPPVFIHPLSFNVVSLTFAATLRKAIFPLLRLDHGRNHMTQSARLHFVFEATPPPSRSPPLFCFISCLYCTSV